MGKSFLHTLQTYFPPPSGRDAELELELDPADEGVEVEGLDDEACCCTLLIISSFRLFCCCSCIHTFSALMASAKVLLGGLAIFEAATEAEIETA